MVPYSQKTLALAFRLKPKTRLYRPEIMQALYLLRTLLLFSRRSSRVFYQERVSALSG